MIETYLGAVNDVLTLNGGTGVYAVAVIEPVSEHQLLLLFAQLFLLLLTARGLGELVKQFDHPAIIGELLAGLILGPSVFGTIAPGVFETVFPPHAAQYHLLDAVGWVGLVLLLIITGLEIDLDLITGRARSATYISLTGIAIPFVTGFGLGWVLPSQFLASGGQRFVFSLFIATAMSVSAIPVIAKILFDLDAIEREVGQIIVTAGMIDDTMGWILLSLVAALAKASGGQALSTAGKTVLMLIVFLGVAFVLGPRLVERIMRWVDFALGGGEMVKITTLVVLALGVGTVTHFMGLEVVLGAFVVGVLFGQVKRFDQATRHTFETVTLGVFAPIFFAIVGLRADLTTLLDPTALLVGGIVLGVAIFGKFVGASAGAKAAGLSNWEGVAMGAGMNARGAIELIVATIGLSIGVLTVEMYSIVVMVAVTTSLMAPPLLRVALSKVDMTDEETERLEDREREREGFLGGVMRVLLPTRCSVASQFSAQLTGHLVRDRDTEVTVMYMPEETESTPGEAVTIDRLKRAISDWVPSLPRAWTDGGARMENGAEHPADECLDLMNDQLSVPGTVRRIVRNAEASASDTVVAEADEGYDLLVIGANKRARDGDTLFSAHIDDVIQTSPCPLMVVTSDMESGDRQLAEVPINRILLPTVGTEYSRSAAEVAFAIADERDALVEVVHVVRRAKPDESLVGDTDVSEAIDLGEEIVEEEAKIGRKMNADVLTDVSAGDRPERDVVTRATEDEVDLIVLGSETRPVSRRAFLGYWAEYIITHAPCPVVVISSL